MATRWLCTLLSLAALTTAVGCGTTATTKAPVTPQHVAETSKPSADSVRTQLAAHRQLQIARLEAYAAEGQFPENLQSPTPLHMFKDQDGRLCAVANLVHQDGHDDLVDETAKYHNDVVLADVKDGPLMDWVLASGLTIEEVAKIQAPAPMVIIDGKPIGDGSAFPGEPPMPVATMQEQLRAHFAQVAAEIEAGTDASLDVAVTRFEASAIASQPIALGPSAKVAAPEIED